MPFTRREGGLQRFVSAQLAFVDGARRRSVYWRRAFCAEFSPAPFSTWLHVKFVLLLKTFRQLAFAILA